jgi:hypothetical protein
MNFALLLLKQKLKFFIYSVLSLTIIQNVCAQKDPSQNDSTKKEDDKILENITFLNAANFDFNTKDLSTSYLGKLNIYAPGIYTKGKCKFGLIAGIMKVKFNYKDSSHPLYRVDNRLINPLDSIKSTTKSLKEYNQYTSTRTNTVWSLYFQPMVQLISFDNQPANNTQEQNISNGLYLNAHFELLINKTNVTTTITNIQRDTAFIDTNYSRALVYIPNNTIIDDETFLNGYFGLGLTLMTCPFKNRKSHYFFQSTFGYTTNYPNWTNQDIGSTRPSPPPSANNNIATRSGRILVPMIYRPKSSAFYLIRSEFMQNISDNSELIIGTDVRGLLPKYNPTYAVYVGLNVNLNSIAKIFSDK